MVGTVDFNGGVFFVFWFGVVRAAATVFLSGLMGERRIRQRARSRFPPPLKIVCSRDSFFFCMVSVDRYSRVRAGRARVSRFLSVCVDCIIWLVGF